MHRIPVLIAAAALALLACDEAQLDSADASAPDAVGQLDAGSPDAEPAEPDDEANRVATDAFFSLAQVHSIAITLEAGGYESLLEQPREYVAATVTIDGAEYAEVGVRLKGAAGSFVALDGDYPEISGNGNGNPGKSGLVLNLKKFVKGQKHLGLTKLTLNNLVQDPSGIHEYAGYALFRQGGVPAPRVGYAQVSLDGQVKGLYAVLESADNKSFLRYWFGNDDGNLYEGQYGIDLREEAIEQFDQDHGKDESRQDLAELVAALDDGEPAAVLDEHFGMEAYLAFAVTELYLGHWDGYVMSANNYRIHHDVEGGQWSFVPWGADQLFIDEMGPFAGVMRGPGPSWEGHGGRIHQLCFASAECRAKLADAFEELFARVEAMDLTGLIADARALVEPLVKAEAVAHGDPQLTQQALEQVSAFVAEREEVIRSWLPCLKGQSVDVDGDGADDCTVDCDHWAPDVHPGAPEQCNLRDDDCNGVVDDPAGCPKCQDVELPDGGGSYTLCIEALSWQQARADCQSRGGELASIHHPMVREHLAFMFLELAGVHGAWIGLNDIADEGSFVWSDGSPLDFDAWGPESPSQEPDDRDCVVNEPWGWMDLPCAEPRAYVCGG